MRGISSSSWSASMGPRLGGRGDAQLVSFRLRTFEASMGPRLGGRGDMSSGVRIPLAMRLQWGRGSVAAETGQARPQPAPVVPSFNGAAARWPRRLTNKFPISLFIERFNGAAARWPRRPPAVRPRPRRQPGSFNGAAARWPRRRTGCTLFQPHLSSFNGAAARWPRRRGNGKPARRGRHTLQWGRGSVAAETQQQALHPLLPSREASMGPRLGGRGDKQRLCRRSRRMDCFNGAAARWPRRLLPL